MHPVDFQRKWIGVTLTEKSASQSHLIDLCHVLGVPTPPSTAPSGPPTAGDDTEPATVAEDTILGRLLALNGERAAR